MPRYLEKDLKAMAERHGIIDLDLKNSRDVGYLIRIAKEATLPGYKNRKTHFNPGNSFGIIGSNVLAERIALLNTKRPVQRVVDFNGLPIHIEIEIGETKSGTGPDGKPWSHTYKFPYGEIVKTEGADGDPVDVYLGPNHDASEVYVVHQLNPDGKFDEDKVMLGFSSKGEAQRAYEEHGPPFGFGSMDVMDLNSFKIGYLASNRVAGHLKNSELKNPSPKTGETEKEFVSRFMASDEANKDYPESEQRTAVAYSIFRSRKNNMDDFKVGDPVKVDIAGVWTRAKVVEVLHPDYGVEMLEESTLGKIGVRQVFSVNDGEIRKNSANEPKNATDICPECCGEMKELTSAEQLPGMECSACGLKLQGDKALEYREAETRANTQTETCPQKECDSSDTWQDNKGNWVCSTCGWEWDSKKNAGAEDDLEKKNVTDSEAKEIWYAGFVPELEGLLEDNGFDMNWATKKWDDVPFDIRAKIKPHLNLAMIKNSGGTPQASLGYQYSGKTTTQFPKHKNASPIEQKFYEHFDSCKHCTDSSGPDMLCDTGTGLFNKWMESPNTHDSELSKERVNIRTEISKLEKKNNGEKEYIVEWMWNGNWRRDENPKPMTLSDAIDDARELYGKRNEKLSQVRVTNIRTGQAQEYKNTQDEIQCPSCGESKAIDDVLAPGGDICSSCRKSLNTSAPEAENETTPTDEGTEAERGNADPKTTNQQTYKGFDIAKVNRVVGAPWDVYKDGDDLGSYKSLGEIKQKIDSGEISNAELQESDLPFLEHSKEDAGKEKYGSRS